MWRIICPPYLTYIWIRSDLCMCLLKYWAQSYLASVLESIFEIVCSALLPQECYALSFSHSFSYSWLSLRYGRCTLHEMNVHTDVTLHKELHFTCIFSKRNASKIVLQVMKFPDTIIGLVFFTYFFIHFLPDVASFMDHTPIINRR